MTSSQILRRLNGLCRTKADEISPGNMKAIVAEGKDILIANHKGNYYAIGSKCTHMEGELVKGKLEGKIITCPRHGSKFEITTGECLADPKVGFIRLKTKNEPKDVIKVEGNLIKVGHKF